MNNFGIDPMVAIRAATYWPSVAMKVSDQVGTVSEGKYADIIAVRGDVLRHINLLQNVDIVIKHGRRWSNLRFSGLPPQRRGTRIEAITASQPAATSFNCAPSSTTNAGDVTTPFTFAVRPSTSSLLARISPSTVPLIFATATLITAFVTSAVLTISVPF